MQKEIRDKGKHFLIQFLIQFATCALISFVLFGVLYWLFDVSFNNALFFSAFIVYFFIGTFYFTTKVTAPKACSHYYAIRESNRAYKKSYFTTNFSIQALIAYLIPPSAMLLVCFIA